MSGYKNESPTPNWNPLSTLKKMNKLIISIIFNNMYLKE